MKMHIELQHSKHFQKYLLLMKEAAHLCPEKCRDYVDIFNS